MNKADLTFQLKRLEKNIEGLHQPATLIHALVRSSGIEQLEPCELEECLKGINIALYHYINEINEQVQFIKGKLGGNDE